MCSSRISRKWASTSTRFQKSYGTLPLRLVVIVEPGLLLRDVISEAGFWFRDVIPDAPASRRDLRSGNPALRCDIGSGVLVSRRDPRSSGLETWSRKRRAQLRDVISEAEFWFRDVILISEAGGFEMGPRSQDHIALEITFRIRTSHSRSHLESEPRTRDHISNLKPRTRDYVEAGAPL